MNGTSATSGCAPTADLLPELALGILGGTERADVLAHLDQCAGCRETSTEWAAIVDVLPILVPEAEPPVGFESRALERLRADRDRVPRRSTMQKLLAVAAIVAVVMIASVAAVRILDARGSDAGSTGVTAADMVGHRGKRAGDAFMTTGSDRYVFLDVDYGVKTGLYRVEALDAANRVVPLGTVVITRGHGAWAGELPEGAGTGRGGPPAMVRLREPGGEVLCVARFKESEA